MLTFRLPCPPLIFRSPLFWVFILGSTSALAAQLQQLPDAAAALYQQLQNPSVIEKSAHLENMVLQRDRVTITFTNGTVYFSPLVAAEARVVPAATAGIGSNAATTLIFPVEVLRVRSHRL